MKKVILIIGLFFAVCVGANVTRSTDALAQVQGNWLDASGTVGTDLRQALPANPSRAFLFVQNMSASNNLAFTVDNTVPGINKAGSLQLAAGASIQINTDVPVGVINVIGSATNTVYTIKYKN